MTAHQRCDRHLILFAILLCALLFALVAGHGVGTYLIELGVAASSSNEAVSWGDLIQATANLVGALLGGIAAVCAALGAIWYERRHQERKNNQNRIEAIRVVFMQGLLPPFHLEYGLRWFVQGVANAKSADQLPDPTHEFAEYIVLDDGLKEHLRIFAFGILGAYLNAIKLRKELIEKVKAARENPPLTNLYFRMSRTHLIHGALYWWSAHYQLCKAIQDTGAIEFGIVDDTFTRFESEIRRIVGGMFNL